MVLLLLALTGGYYFTQVCHVTRYQYRISKEEGHRLIFMLLRFTVPILVLSYLFLLGVSSVLPKYYVSLVAQEWRTLTGPLYTPALAIFFAAFVLGPLLGWIVNQFYRADKASTYVLEKYGGPLEQLLWKAITEVTLLSVTLKNQTVYVGFPGEAEVITSADDLPYLRLLVLLRGYRDDKSLELRITDEYATTVDEIINGNLSGTRVEDFAIIIPRAEIASVSTFSIDENRTFPDSSSRGQNSHE